MSDLTWNRLLHTVLIASLALALAFLVGWVS